MTYSNSGYFSLRIVKCFLILLLLLTPILKSFSGNLSDRTFLITIVNANNFNNQAFWDIIQNNNTSGIEVEVTARSGKLYLKNSNEEFSKVLKKINTVVHADASKILPVFVNFNDNIALLDSIINGSEISSFIFFLPQDEAWPTDEYLIQANRRVIFFADGEFKGTSRILHPIKNYALTLSASQSFPTYESAQVNQALMIIDNFDKLETNSGNRLSANLVPDYTNYLLENWGKYGKRPNFVFVGTEISYFKFITDQLNSFSWISGTVKNNGISLEKVYWKNPEIVVTGGVFCFPLKGGEELILSPFAPGFKFSPEQIIVTGEMTIPETYHVMATPALISQNLTGSFNFDNNVLNSANNAQNFEGSNYLFVQDIKRGNVLRLPENSSINLGNPEIYGLRNSSFTVSCFVKFAEILEFGDNAILGNYEKGYRKGLHLVLRSGHPYFGLWANDFMSTQTLEPNTWYHLAWRYVIETGEQAIFLNGKYIGGSDGHPPFSGTGDIHLGSALSLGASLRGYIDNLYIWNRPLGAEEINRLSLDEPVSPNQIMAKSTKISGTVMLLILLTVIIIGLAAIIYFYINYKKSKTTNQNQPAELPLPDSTNCIELFGEFKAIDKEGIDITELFTPKVKELLLFTIVGTLTSGIGAGIQEINEKLWFGIGDDKVANNRSVTLNKLRKLLLRFEGIEIVSNGGYLQAKIRKPLYCDFFNAYKLCQIPEGLTRPQLISFFEMVKRGRFMKGTHWTWLDEIRGYTGNQVIDILLNLAIIYQKEMNLSGIEKIAQRILDYDDLNEEAIYLQVWALQKANNQNLAKFSFNSFIKKYEANMGEPYSLNYQQFNQHFEKGFK